MCRWWIGTIRPAVRHRFGSVRRITPTDINAARRVCCAWQTERNFRRVYLLRTRGTARAGRISAGIISAYVAKVARPVKIKTRKTCACSSQICETGVWNEAKGECVECIQSSDCQDLTKPVCNTANNTCEACSKDLKGELFGDCGKCNSFGMAGKNTAAEIPACKTCSSSTNYLFQNAADGTTNSCGICKDGKPESTAATNTTRFEYNEQTGMCIDKCPRVAISDALTITRYGIYGNNTHMALWKNETECTYVFKITGKHVGLCTDCGATGTIPNGKCYYGSVEKETSPPRQGPKTVPFEIENAFSVSPGKFAKVSCDISEDITLVGKAESK